LAPWSSTSGAPSSAGWFTRTLDDDIHGELLSAVVDNSGAITSITYDQDALGRRAGRAVTTGGGGGGGGGSTTERVRWIYKDATNPVAAFDDADRITAHYVYFKSGHVPDLVVRYAPSGDSVLRLITDIRGSVRLASDIDTGFVVQQISNDPWLDTT
jgi:hypothetical protein